MPSKEALQRRGNTFPLRLLIVSEWRAYRISNKQSDRVIKVISSSVNRGNLIISLCGLIRFHGSFAAPFPHLVSKEVKRMKANLECIKRLSPNFLKAECNTNQNTATEAKSSFYGRFKTSEAKSSFYGRFKTWWTEQQPRWRVYRKAKFGFVVTSVWFWYTNKMKVGSLPTWQRNAAF